jgi:hypothetical protein
MNLNLKLIALAAGLGMAVTTVNSAIVATLDFESAGGYTTSTTEFISGSTDYFTRTDGSDIGGVGYSNSGFWFAAQDIDAVGATLPVSLFWSVDITGYSGLSFNFDVAEDDDGTNQDWDASYYVHVNYSIDGGSAQNLIWFENDGSTFNSAPFQDTDFDGVGDGAEVTETFSNFSSVIAGSGSTLTIEIIFSLDSGDEDFAMDNLQVTAVPEPSTYALLLGFATLGFVLYRRRRA